MSNQIQADPQVYPRCAACKTPYILRLGLMLDGEQEWAWFRDCKHRKAAPETVDNRKRRPRNAKRAPRTVGVR